MRASLRDSSSVIDQVFGEYVHKVWMECTSMLLNFVPVVGSLKAIAEGIVGHDLLTGRQYAWWERAFNIGMGSIALVGEVGLLAVTLKEARLAGKLSEVAAIAGNSAVKAMAEAISKLRYTLKYSIDELAYQIKRVVSIGDETVVDLGNGITYAIREADDVAEAARPAYREVIQGIWKYSGKTADEIADFYLSKVASKTKVSGKFSGSPSEILRAELKDAGVTTPPYANQAHHIVPEGMDIPELNEARAIMESYGVDLNSASNGVFLPNAQNLPHAGSAAVHSGSHTAEYARYVANAIKRANPTSAADITEVLNRLRKELLNGTLKLNSL
ncbi:hypothetical protein CLHUN_42620 [Ruminiclostridium hungatei]|uniref:Pre-toxin TG domain-containing protein n=1 Tax=Ruminiclostridium hungatei TaxID=48256 RepID=A0A1V4SDQ4_RUMHU|nr:hypothetical protein CLHUN_42620 [Ruminiclostridium hungatei]